MADLATRIAELATRIAGEFNTVRAATKSGVCTITFPASGAYETQQTVVLAGVTPANRILLGLAPADDTDENDPEFLAVGSICGIAGTDSFDVEMTSPERVSGPVKLNYVVT